MIIEYIYNSDLSVYFKPLNNGRCEYDVKVHNFVDLDCAYGKVDYHELNEIIADPQSFIDENRIYTFKEQKVFARKLWKN